MRFTGFDIWEEQGPLPDQPGTRCLGYRQTPGTDPADALRSLHAVLQLCAQVARRKRAADALAGDPGAAQQH